MSSVRPAGLLSACGKNFNAVIFFGHYKYYEYQTLHYGSTCWPWSIHTTFRWHLLGRSPHHDCLSDGSNGQIKQDLAVKHHQLCKQIRALEVFCHLHPLLWLWNMDPACWLCKEESRLSKPSAWGNFSVSPTSSTRPTTVCGARPTSLWVHRNLFWQLPRDGNSHGSGSDQRQTMMTTK